MATASRSRRPVMATPPPKTQSRVNTYTIEEKQQLLDNFDLEVEDKIRSFESHLALTLQSFVLRQDSELFRIPRELRSMTLRDLQKSWGGSLAGTVMRLKRDRIEMEERERMEREEEERKAKEKEAKGKRKLEDVENSPGRSKNARKDGKTTAKGGKRKATTTVKKGKSAPSRTSTSQPSGLPQNHIFNPLLPQTPRLPRAPRRGESFLSVNGSPLARPGTSDPNPDANADADGDDETIREDEEERDSDDDLPDPKAYEAKLAKSQRALGKSTTASITTSTSSSSKSKMKRGPSLMFRQSLAPPTLRHQDDEGLASVSLKDGRVISFNPLELSPGRIENEMKESGMGDRERELTRAQIKEEVVKALSERMEKWSGLG